MTKQDVGELHSGRRFLESLRRYTRDILAAADKQHGGSVDVSALNEAKIKHDSTGRIAWVVGGVYHADGGADDDNLDNEEGWLDLRAKYFKEKWTIRSKKLDRACTYSILQ